jgi:hypothetical protein
VAAGSSFLGAIKSIPGTASGPEKVFTIFQTTYDKARVAGKGTWKQLNQPFMANMAGVGAQNVLVTLWTKETSDSTNSQPAMCTDASTEEAAIVQMMQEACSEKPGSSTYTSTLKLGGVEFELNMVAVAGNSIPDSAYCKKQ